MSTPIPFLSRSLRHLAFPKPSLSSPARRTVQQSSSTSRSRTISSSSSSSTTSSSTFFHSTVARSRSRILFHARPRPQSHSIRSASTIPGGSSSSFRSQILKPTSILLIFVPIVCGFLGVWQVKRLRWKVALIEEVNRNLHKDPMVLPSNINLDVLPEFSFRRVLLSGTPLPIPILLGPSLMEGTPGYSLILPFARDGGGSTILLNRGFIPVARAAAIRSGALPPGFVRRSDGEVVGEKLMVEGLLPRTGDRSYFTPENDPRGNEWFWRDVQAMTGHVKDEAERLGLGLGGRVGKVQDVMVDVIEQGNDPATYMMQQDIPIGRASHIELRNQHAQYAVIWFSLSAATAAMLGFVLTKGRRGPSSRSDRRLRI